MVKQREKNNRKKRDDKGFRENRTDASKLKLGHRFMVTGILMLLFIGFNRSCALLISD